MTTPKKYEATYANNTIKIRCNSMTKCMTSTYIPISLGPSPDLFAHIAIICRSKTIKSLCNVLSCLHNSVVLFCIEWYYGRWATCVLKRQKIEKTTTTQLEIFGLDFDINTHYCFGNVIRLCQLLYWIVYVCWDEMNLFLCEFYDLQIRIW